MQKLGRYLFLLFVFYMFYKCVLPKETIEQTSTPKKEQTKSKSTGASLAELDFNCMGRSFDFERYLYQDVAKKMEAQKLLYNSRNPSKLQDCSGIFHRVVQQVSKKVNSKCSQFSFPSLQTRSSKSLVAWYHKQGNLVLVGDPRKFGDLVQVGTVVFYGQQGKRYSKPSIGELSNSGGVQHLGIVVDVERDASGKLLNYGLFHGHGRHGVQPADISYFHRWKDSHLAYGNGSQQMVGLANLLSEK